MAGYPGIPQRRPGRVVRQDLLFEHAESTSTAVACDVAPGRQPWQRLNAAGAGSAIVAADPRKQLDKSRSSIRYRPAAHMCETFGSRLLVGRIVNANVDLECPRPEYPRLASDNVIDRVRPVVAEISDPHLHPNIEKQQIVAIVS